MENSLEAQDTVLIQNTIQSMDEGISNLTGLLVQNRKHENLFSFSDTMYILGYIEIKRAILNYTINNNHQLSWRYLSFFIYIFNFFFFM